MNHIFKFGEESKTKPQQLDIRVHHIKSKPVHQKIEENVTSLFKKVKDGPPTFTRVPKVSHGNDRASIIAELRDLQNRQCPDDMSRLMVLEDRDKLLYKLRAVDDKYPSVSPKKQLNGTLNSMCTEKERYRRTVQKRISIFECYEDGKMCPNSLVKEYSRSAADQDKPLPHELRRPDMLNYTMIHLLVLDAMPEFEEQGQWYSFIWDRTRAIRKEITQLMLSNTLAVSLLECCTRFHIISSYILCSQGVEKFDQNMNTENLNKCLLTLRHLYDDLAKKGIFCDNEVEFRAYDVLLHLRDSNVFRQVLSYRKDVREAPPVRLAIQLASAMQTNNFVRFFQFLRKKGTFLQCCICHRFFTQIRSKALEVLNKSGARNQAGNINFKIPYLIKVLAFDDEKNALEILGQFGIFPSDSNSDEVLFTKEHMHIGTQPMLVTYEWVDSKSTSNLSEIVNGSPVGDANVLPEICNSFDQNGYYRNDPVLAEIFKANPSHFSSIPAVEEPVSIGKKKTQPIISQTEIAAREERDRKLAEEQKAKAEKEKKLLEIKIEKEKQDEIKKQHKLQIQRQQEEIKRRMTAVLPDLCSVVQEDAVSHLLKKIITEELNRLKTQQKLFHELVQTLTEKLIANVVDMQIKLISKSVLKERIKEVEVGLTHHKQRFSNLWLKQFWDQWRNKVQARKEARRKRNSAWEDFKPNWNASLFSPNRYLTSPTLTTKTSANRQESPLSTKQRLRLAQLRRRRTVRITSATVEHWKQFTKKKILEKKQAETILLAHAKRPFSLRRPHPTEGFNYNSSISENSPARKAIRLTLEESLNFPTVPLWINRRNVGLDDSFVPNTLEESAITEEDVSIARREIERRTSLAIPQETFDQWNFKEMEEKTELEETLETTELIEECRQSNKRSDDMKKKADILVENIQKHKAFLSQLENAMIKRQSN